MLDLRDERGPRSRDSQRASLQLVGNLLVISFVVIIIILRCWTYETSVALDQEIPNELPYNDYFEYFGPDFKLHIAPSNMANQNTGEYVDKIRSRLVQVEKLRIS